MIPDIKILTQEITEQTYPTRTYGIKVVDTINSNASQSVNNAEQQSIIGSMVIGVAVLGVTYSAKDRISGYIDGIDAIIQAIYLILSTERYQHIIYSWDYGVELLDLYGKPMPYVMAELPRRITEALTQDDRITGVTDFKFERNGKQLHTTFTVVSTLGNINTALEVEV